MEDQRADAGAEQRHADVQICQQRYEDGRAGHRERVLEAEGDLLACAERLIGGRAGEEQAVEFAEESHFHTPLFFYFESLNAQQKKPFGARRA